VILGRKGPTEMAIVFSPSIVMEIATGSQFTHRHTDIHDAPLQRCCNANVPRSRHHVPI
jgi:hypothetical protein